METIQGSKGSKQRTPVESPNTLKSVAIASIVDLVSEGEIVGLVDEMKSVFLDETPVENDDGTLNFKNISVEWRNGTQNQDYIASFPAVENELGVAVELKYDTPYERTFSNLNLNAVRVRLSVAALSYTNTSNGDISGHTVNYAIDVSTDGGPYVQQYAGGFAGKTMSKYERDHRINLPTATSGWTVRVRRTTTNATTSNIQDKTYVESMVEIIDAKLRYPNSAIIGIKLDASQFQNVPTRAYDLKGRIIRVPTNYNPETRVYATSGPGTSSGIWDGTFKLAWTDNPAWIYLDLITHFRYGLGHLLNDDHLNKWALYKIAKYCDELVPDGKGGYEPRFTCNLYLQKQGDAYKVIQDLATVFRGVAYWSNGQIVPVGDMPEDPVYTYTPANVVGGRFAYQGTSARVRHNVILVSWNDPNNFGRSVVEYVDDAESIVRYGIKETDMTAIGCNSQGQAQRMGRYALLTSNYETQSVSFTVGLEGTLVAPGKIIRVADPLKAGKRYGGRLKQVISNTQVVLDAPAPDVLVGDSLTIIKSDGISETRPISAIAGTTITVYPAFTEAPEKSTVWAIDKPELETQRFRVISVTENSSDDVMTYTISAVQHNASKFSAVDFGTRVDVPNISGVPSPIQRPPTSVTISSHEAAGEVLTSTVLTVDWVKALNAVAYEVEYRRDNNDWVKLPRTQYTTVDIPNVWPGVYTAKVRAVGPSSILSEEAYAITTHTVVDQTRTPRILGGNGTNLIPDEYSTLEQPTVPPLTINTAAGTVTRSDTDKIVYGSYVFNATGSNLYAYLGTTYNINIASGKRYIVSFWAKGSVAGNADVYIQDSTGALYSGQVAITTSWTRVSALIDLSASTSNSIRVRIDNDLGAGSTLYVDGVMIEEAIGTNNKPSTYTRGVAARLSLAALIAAQNAQATADGQIDIYRQSAAPSIGGSSGAKLGDYWQDSDDGKWYYCNGTTWIDATDTRLPQVVIDAATAQSSANTAQTTANARIRLFVQETQPTGGTYIVGDMWFQSSTNITRYFNGTGWSQQADNSLVTQAYTSLVKDGGFEAGGQGWTLTNGAYFEVSTNAAYAGTRGVVLPGNPTGTACEVYSDYFPVSKGDRLVADAFLRNLSGGANGNFYLAIWFYNPDGSWNGVNNQSILYSTGTQIGTTSWRRVVAAAIAPDGAGLARIGVYALGQTTGYYCADQFRVVKTQRTESKAANLIPNANFGGVNGDSQPWVIGWNPAGATVTLRNKKTTLVSGSDYTIVGNVGVLEISQGLPGGGSPGYIDTYCGPLTGSSSNKIPVKANTRYQLHTLMANHRCTSQIGVAWYDASDAYISESATAMSGGLGGKTEDGYTFAGTFVTSPSNATKAFIFYRRTDTQTGQTSSFSWYLKPFFGEASEYQIEFTPWADSAPYNADSIGSGSSYSVVSTTDVHDNTGDRRIGLRVRGSRQILGGARNSRASLVAGVSSVRTATALSANNSGQVTVNAHSIEISGETVTYNTVTNAVTGLTVGATYVIFTIDPFLDGGTRTYYAQTSVLSAQQAGDGCVFIGNVTIPTTGSSSGGDSGGGGPGTFCVDWDSMLPNGKYVRNLQIGDMVECIDVTKEEPEIELHPVIDLTFGKEKCYKLTTKLGVNIIQSASTPMDLPDGRIVTTEEMLGEAVLSKIDGQVYWDYVERIESLDIRKVVKLNLGNRMFFAGQNSDKTLATHNANYKP